jgi:cell division protease FtsH
MDGFEKDTNVIVMAATNRPDILDPALLRPGRFDRRVVVDLPDLQDRTKILVVHGRNKPLEEDVNLEKIAKHTPGFSGADLENLMNEAAILAARNARKKVKMDDLEKSIEKVVMGPERKSRVLNDKEKKITAYHEVGHAVVGHMTEHCDPVQKVSIISRGMALGVTWFVPDEDKHLYSKAKFEDEMASLLGGYCAEEIFFGDITTGASNDLEKATGIARRMVTEYGMSDLGPVIYADKNHEVFIGRDLGHTKNYSEEKAAQIDKYITAFVTTAYKRAHDTIAKNKDVMKEIAEYLLEKESISREEFVKFFPANKKSKAVA